MVEGSAFAPISSRLRMPQHEHESTLPTGSKFNKGAAYSVAKNALIDNISQERVCQKLISELQTPFHRGRRNVENQNESQQHRLEQQYRHHSNLQTSLFIFPPATKDRPPCGSELAVHQQRRKHQYTRIQNDGLQFVSPKPSFTGVGTKIQQRMVGSNSRKARPEPLVLDPSVRSLPGQLGACNSEHRRVTLSSTSSASLMDSRGGNSTVQKLFQVATKGIREHHATVAQYATPDSSCNDVVNARGYLHTTPAARDVAYGTTASSAAVFARSNGVVQAGFLQKLGKNIPEFKRRFFVLKAETSLYYYLSPNETEPRGKIDLEGSAIKQLEKSPDGRLRFVIAFKGEDCSIQKNEFGGSDSPNENNDTTQSYQQKQQIVLEARSKEIGEEWIRHMKEERVSFLADKNETIASKNTKLANQIADLEHQIQHFRMIEADRDGALEDAQNWKNKFNRLDEALRLLTQQIRKSLTTLSAKEIKNDQQVDDSDVQMAGNQIFDGNKLNANFDDEYPNNMRFAPNEDVRHKVSDINQENNPIKSNSEVALLDYLAYEGMDVEEIMDVPGTYFSGLSNACKQQKESSRLASIEASSAVEDVLQSNKQVEVIQKRMYKAEKQILKLWEENCVVRKALKQKKREKRVLVKEVKQLQQTVRDLKSSIKQVSSDVLGPSKSHVEDGPMADTIIGSDEERLIIELEEHVASSIRLHERLVAGTDFDRDMEQSISTDVTSINFDKIDIALTDRRSRVERGELETSKAKLLSLFDDETYSDESDVHQEEDSKKFDSRIETQSLIVSIESLEDDMAIAYKQPIVSAEKSASLPLVDTNISSPLRVNPLLELDDDIYEEGSKLKVVKPSSPKLITENGQATSQLICPLADVIDVRGRRIYSNEERSAAHKGIEDLRVHHLTFYSQKIGLQFQKAPPVSLKPRGLLTDAVTADLGKDVDGSDKTAAELRRASSIAFAKDGKKGQRKKCKRPLAAPEDVVLVCGFDGFDDLGINKRPKLGARLVAFDGISVDEGKWTFERIRKAIKSRGRPLTLSFRNDFLTTEQRATLTKAIKDVDIKRDPAHSIMDCERSSALIPPITSASSFESGQFLNIVKNLDVSTAATEESNCWNRWPASSSSSVSSDFKDNQIGRLLAPPPSSSSVSTHKSRNSNSIANITNDNLSSLKEDGSSSASLSLMDVLETKNSSSSELKQRRQLLLGGKKNKEKGFEQSRRFGIGVNPSGTRQHQHFESNLL